MKRKRLKIFTLTQFLVYCIFFQLWGLEPDSLFNEKVYQGIMEQANQRIGKYRKGATSLQILDENGKPVANKRFKVQLKSHDFYFGNIVQPLIMKPGKMDFPEKYKERFKEYHNLAVLPFFWAFYEPQPGITMDSRYPDLIKWAQENKITLKGHPLAWGSRPHLPGWLFEMNADSSESLLLKRIETITRKYKDDINLWDVVNEPTHTSPWSRAVDTTKYQITDLSLKEINEIVDWTEKCFRAAHRGNPEAMLILNDYETIWSASNSSAFFMIVKELLRRGTPVHGIGIQAHNPKDCWYPPVLFLSVLDSYAQLGLPIHITEFHPLSRDENITGGWIKGNWNETAQADFAEMMYTLAFSHPAVVSFTNWGLTDKYIWRDGAGYYDENYEPKESAKRINDLVNNKWQTLVELVTDSNGTAEISGFYGTYNILNDKKQVVGEFQLSKSQKDNKFTLK